MNAYHSVNDNDVLCGRGGGTNNHKGNIMFRQIVASRQSTYLNAQKAEKKLVAESIVHQIRQKGGRFLKYNDRGELEDIGDKEANKKTCQALREGMGIRMHRQNGRNDQITSTFYPPQNHSFSHQSPWVQNSNYGVNPPITTQTCSPPMLGQSYKREAYQHQHLNYAHYQQRPMRYNYYEESERHTGGCNCAKSNCLKLYCRCFSNSNFCQPNACHCKDCHNTPGHVQEVNEARSKTREQNMSSFHSIVACATNCNACTTDNKWLLRNQCTSSQRNARFSCVGGCGYVHGMSDQISAPVAMSSHRKPLSPVSPCFQNDRPMVHKTGCRCQKTQCVKRYCECFNAGVKCSGNCQCVDCKNA